MGKSQRYGTIAITSLCLLLWGLLSGCVDYEIGLQFEGPYRGAIVQHIHLNEKLVALKGTGTPQWLQDLELRAKRVGGKLRRTSEQDWQLTIPFFKGQDLQTRFNQFFADAVSPPSAAVGAAAATLPIVPAHLKLTQNNWLLAIRHHLTVEVDLESFKTGGDRESLWLNTADLLHLELQLKTPWQASSLGEISPTTVNSHSLQWPLPTGQKNRLEAVFWLANPLGIGAVVIGAIVATGLALR